MEIKIDGDGYHKEILFWLPDLEFDGFYQARNVATLPFIHNHVAIMPDAHTGYGVPIGCVFGTYGVVIPNAVGVDIGCGMTATRIYGITKQMVLDKADALKEYVKKFLVVRDTTEFSQYKKSLIDALNGVLRTSLLNDEPWEQQLGTLGGGNHFIEFQTDEDGWLWLMVHSGSRNLGQVAAKYYNKKAEDLCRAFHIKYPKDLAYLPAETHEGRDYISDMKFCKKFASRNRHYITHEIINFIVQDTMHLYGTDTISCCHNYAALEYHMGKTVYVHRKGATSAKSGELGIIPGSQGTNSYIVEGLGDPSSFMSCSHGAGRVLSRKAAKDNLNLEEEKAKMDEKGIIHNLNSRSKLDEAPGAYKDIDVVMERQADLVNIKHKLTPFMVFKN